MPNKSAAILNVFTKEVSNQVSFRMGNITEKSCSLSKDSTRIRRWRKGQKSPGNTIFIKQQWWYLFHIRFNESCMKDVYFCSCCSTRMYSPPSPPSRWASTRVPLCEVPSGICKLIYSSCELDSFVWSETIISWPSLVVAAATADEGVAIVSPLEVTAVPWIWAPPVICCNWLGSTTIRPTKKEQVFWHCDHAQINFCVYYE